VTPRRQRPRAFTLLELVLVMVVVSVLAVAAVPRLTASLARGRLEDQCLAFVSLARRAKALASTEGRSYVLVVDPETKEMRLRRRRDPMAEPDSKDEPELEAQVDAFWAAPVKFRDDVKLLEGELNDEALYVAASIQIEFFQDGSADRARLLFQGKAPSDQLVVAVDPNLGVARILSLEAEAEREGVTK
jgi:prepilin-type N-terminal cleavage/methylation domain-containing protein